jgi:serine protease Do
MKHRKDENPMLRGFYLNHQPRRGLDWRHTTALLVGLLLAVALMTAPAVARGAPDSFAELAEKLSPAVVNISTTQVVRGEPGGRPEFQVPPGSPFEDFFKEFFERNQQKNRPRRATSLGSGFVIDSSGLVVTNNHVIAEAEEISVRFPDGERFKAKLVGRDPKTDLALLKIETKKQLPSLTWGDSSRSRVGDWVLAIGNPFGLGGSVTAGIISAYGRDINAGPYDDFIQTDASINRGNSGGPLFNLNGEVIGINTAIFSPSGGSVGIGFAIPSSLARNVIQQLKDYGQTKRGWLGVRIQTVTDEIAEGLRLESARGALVAGVSEDGPAAAAGIKQGDVILRFDKKKVEEMRALPRIVAETQIGKKVEVVVWRKGKRVKLQVTIAELEESETKVALAKPGAPDKVEALGMMLSTLTPETRKQFELADDVAGVVVLEVDGDSPAAEKGIRPGDVIVEVQQDVVAKPADVVARVDEVREAKRRSVLLLVRQRAGELRFVAVKVDEEE